MSFEIKQYKKFNKKSYSSFILGGDIGGTNTNLGIFGVKNKFPKLLVSFHFKSRDLKELYYAVNKALEHVKNVYGISVDKACLAVAGVLSSNQSYARLTNAPWNVNKKILLKKSKLKKVILINDFEAIGYGINMLKKSDVYIVKSAKRTPKAPVLVVGAGTGLGKTTLIFAESYKSYAPIPSEAGHSDFAAQTQEEVELINFIKKYRKIRQNVSYEQVLSGQGLINIYLFLRKNKNFPETEHTKEIGKSKNKPELISKYRKIDKTCKAAFDIFKKIYARFAKNFALDCLAFGGVYIAGGIALKNKDIFNSSFIKTFEKNYKHEEVLKKMPIFLILNYNVGLLGAGLAGAKLI